MTMGSLDDLKLAAKDRKRTDNAPSNQKPRKPRQTPAHARAAQAVAENITRVAASVKAQTEANQYQRFIDLLAIIADVAWLRVIPKPDEGITHWYVKWNRGKHKGCYVYFGQHETDRVIDAVDFLTIRFSEVEQGIRKPIRDTAYRGDESR
jgi:hypothetical protein